MSSTLCDICREQEATVFVTKVLNNKATKQRLCETCARRRAGEGWIQQLGGEMNLPSSGAFGEALQNLPLDEIVRSLFEQVEFTEEEALEADANDSVFGSTHLNMGEFPADEDAVDDIDEALQDEADGENHETHPPFVWGTPRNIASARCSKCGTTWDRLRQDGRVGCVECYNVFQAQLSEVMERLQQAVQHMGKHPRAAAKRRRRLEHLRARRDHRLAMLQRRLQEAVSTENYEEAAKIRDKIKMVASTIVAPGNAS
jgi:protein-arginine kinase activator protein McsA